VPTHESGSRSTISQTTFRRGDPVVWRSIPRNAREVHAVLGFTGVIDDSDLVALFIAPGWPTMRRTGVLGGGPRGRMLVKPDGGHALHPWVENEALVLYRPGEAHSVWLYWRAADHEFREWYVNLEEPWRRTSIGFDSRDNLLDIVVAPDLASWHWKDEDELAWAVGIGRHTAEEAAAFHREGKRAMEQLRRHAFPFDRDWPSWKPEPDWSAPSLPHGWNVYIDGS